MEKYDFDKVIDRRGTGAIKYEWLDKLFGRQDLLPLWVADMDFETPPFIMEALEKRMAHPVLGYTETPEELWETVMAWILAHHGWTVRREWMSFVPGIVKGIGMVVNFFVKPGEKVIIQPPVYHPFRNVPLGNKREVVYNPLREEADGSYTMDFDNLESVTDEHCKLLILSNPHNPAGIVWNKTILQRLADFCRDHHLLVVSDEIHCDMALWGHRHHPFASVSDAAASCSITFGAPTKTFNMAGVVSSYAIVPNAKLREPFFAWMKANELGDPNMFAPIATVAAFRYGERWRCEMLRYVEKNVEYVEEYCAAHIPRIRPLRPQASFLVWLDCRALRLSHAELNAFFVDKARLALNDGEMFGKGGEGFMRMNVGAPRFVIEQAMKQLRAAVDGMS